MITGVLYHIFSLWCSYVLQNEVHTLQFKNGHFDQCNQTATLLSEGKVTNFRNYIAEYKSHNRSKLLILACLTFLLFHVIECLTNCHNGVATLSEFVYGPDSQECSDNSKPEEGIELEEVRQNLREDVLVRKRSPKSKSNFLIMLFRGFMSLLGVMFLFLLFYAPNQFHLLKIDVSRGGMINHTYFVCFTLKAHYLCRFLDVQNYQWCPMSISIYARWDIV